MLISLKSGKKTLSPATTAKVLPDSAFHQLGCILKYSIRKSNSPSMVKWVKIPDTLARGNWKRSCQFLNSILASSLSPDTYLYLSHWCVSLKLKGPVGRSVKGNTVMVIGDWEELSCPEPVGDGGRQEEVRALAHRGEGGGG